MADLKVVSKGDLIMRGRNAWKSLCACGKVTMY